MLVLVFVQFSMFVISSLANNLNHFHFYEWWCLLFKRCCLCFFILKFLLTEPLHLLLIESLVSVPPLCNLVFIRIQLWKLQDGLIVCFGIVSLLFFSVNTKWLVHFEFESIQNQSNIFCDLGANKWGVGNDVLYKSTKTWKLTFSIHTKLHVLVSQP